jgi:hypothetical protein
MKSSIARLGLSGQLAVAFGLPAVGLVAITVFCCCEHARRRARHRVVDRRCAAGGRDGCGGMGRGQHRRALPQATTVTQRLSGGNLTDAATVAEHGPCAELGVALRALRERWAVMLGKLFVVEMARLGRNQGSGRVEYKWSIR